MKPPASLKIAHATFTVEANTAECEAAGTNGHFLADRRRIAYDTSNAPDKVREVLLHEALHACIEVSRLDLGTKKEEEIVDRLTGPLLDLLRRNPRFLDFLLA